jgi:transposase-like protein
VVSAILFQVKIFLKEARDSAPVRSCRVTTRAESPWSTILVIPLSAGEDNLVADWAAACAGVMVRRCPICEHDSIIGHGRRRKQAHDERHDWIQVRRGLCNECGKTFTLLPSFSLPYTHYSLPARVQALHRRFVEGRCWESSAPTLQRMFTPSRHALPGAK